MSVVSHTSPTADYIQILNRITNTRASFIQIKMPTADDMNHEKEKKIKKAGDCLCLCRSMLRNASETKLSKEGDRRERRVRACGSAGDRASGSADGKPRNGVGSSSVGWVRGAKRPFGGAGPTASGGWMTRGAHVLAGSGRVVGDSVSSSSSPNSVRTCRWCLTFLLLDEKSKYSFITFIFFMIDVFVRKKKQS